jgi:hypothetical protein
LALGTVTALGGQRICLLLTVCFMPVRLGGNKWKGKLQKTPFKFSIFITPTYDIKYFKNLKTSQHLQ